jgi:hypothetical protein
MIKFTQIWMDKQDEPYNKQALQETEEGLQKEEEETEL